MHGQKVERYKHMKYFGILFLIANMATFLWNLYITVTVDPSQAVYMFISVIGIVASIGIINLNGTT